MNVFKINRLVFRRIMLCVYYSAILVLKFSAVNSQINDYEDSIESPCPDVFEYQRDAYGTYGVIHLKVNRPLTHMMITANFTIATRLDTNNQGRLEPIGNSTDPLQDFNRGTPLNYRVDFPVTRPLPRPIEITANGNVLCYGLPDLPGPKNPVTPISLQHSLFLKDKSGPAFINQFRPQSPQSHQMPAYLDGEYLGQVPVNPGTLTEGVKKSQPSWSSLYWYMNSDNRSTYVPGAVLEPPKFEETQYYPEPEVTRPPTRLQWPVKPNMPSPLSLNVASDTKECGIVSENNERRPIIHNGQTYKRGDWPWLVAIYKKKDKNLSFICAGTLVSDRHVITAAQCSVLYGAVIGIKDIVIKIGIHTLEDSSDNILVTRTVARGAVHESYNASTRSDDIMIFTLEKAVEFSPYIRPACLWRPEDVELSRIVGFTGVVVGWGAYGHTQPGHKDARVARIEVVDTATCRTQRPQFKELTPGYTFCGGDRNSEGPCLGDNGAGMYLLDGGRWRLRGIISIILPYSVIQERCDPYEYIVFTDTAKYMDWIIKNLT